MSELSQCQKACDLNMDDHREIYKEMNERYKTMSAEMSTKTPVSLFTLLVLLVVSSLGFQWNIYKEMQGIAKDVAVIKVQMK